ncbi:MAG: oxygenase MpaB family protein [Verrucomicrobiota bacterium]
MRNNAVQRILSKRFRILLTGDPDGVPPWLDAVAASDAPGLYLPNEAPWVAHADLATLVGGIRALLMQALHPGSLTGVREHSRYKDDPLGRLSGTIRWLTVTTFASTASVETEANRVNRMHAHVKGKYTTASGKEVDYSAFDPQLLRWVHIAFMDSFLRSHQAYSTRPLPGGADAYVRLWSKSVIPLGLTEVPMSEAELLSDITRYRSELVVNEQTREVIGWIRNPPLPVTSLPAYRFLFRAALASLPKEFQSMIGLGHPSLTVMRPITINLLRFIRLAIGPESPIEEAAIERLHRSGQMKDGKVIA